MPDFYSDNDNYLWKQLRKFSETTCIVSTGFTTHKAVIIADEFKNVSVFDICKIKPICENLLMLLSRFKKIICLEEHSLTGGIGSLLSEVATDREWNTRIKRVSISDVQCLFYGDRLWLQEKHNLSYDKVKEEIKNI